MVILSILTGGALGALLRYLISHAISPPHANGFPWGTLVVNVLGSLAIGILAAWFAKAAPSPAIRAFLMTGLLGALTTFSTFSLDTILLGHQHGIAHALFNVALHNVLCLTVATTGYLVVGLIFR